MGQTDGQVDFLARGLGYTVFLTGQGAVLSLGSNQKAKGESQKSLAARRRPQATGMVRLNLLGANRAAKVSGLEELPGKANYFIGNDPSRWRRDVPTFAKVKYEEVYPGVDLIYYGSPAEAGKLEYDFMVKPGANPKAIELAVENRNWKLEDRKSKLEIAANGDLVVKTHGGEVRFHKPVVYQPVAAVYDRRSPLAERRYSASNRQSSIGNRQFLDARYALRAGNRVGFEIPGYDQSRPLIIDPVLDYSTYIGGTGGDTALGIAVDASGNAFITGMTNSSNYPAVAGFSSSYRGSGDAFVSEFKFVAGPGTGTGLTLVYSTYFGGSGIDSANAIAVDATGDVFITGSTTSPDLPVVPVASGSSTTNAFQTTYGGGGDAFVTEFGSAGNSLVYSSYLGGTGADFGQGIAVDGSGNAYVTGSTQSSDFPTVTPIQVSNAGASDAFVAKVNIGGTQLLYSTYLGGSLVDAGQSIKVDSSGNAYVTGNTFSADFPLKNPIQTINAGSPTLADAFVAELNSTGSALNFSTFLGGSGDDRGLGIALDSSANIYVAGVTTPGTGAQFPTTSGAFQTVSGGSGDAFVVKYHAGGTSVIYSTFLGGSGVDKANSIAVDSSGDAFIAGNTASSDFPTLNAVQANLGIIGGSACGTSLCSDAFVTELNPSGGGLVYSTFLGGSAADFGSSVALDSTGLAYVTGSTSSTNFPAVAGAFQGELKGLSGNAFVAKVNSANGPGIAIVPQILDFGNQTIGVISAEQDVLIVDVGTAALDLISETISSTSTTSTDFTIVKNTCGSLNGGGANCALGFKFTPSILGQETATVTITDNTATSPHTFKIQGTGTKLQTQVTLAPTSLTFGNQTVTTNSAAQNVTITNSGTSALTINSLSTSAGFTQTNTCTAAPLNGVLNLGQSCTASVVFAPTSTGAIAGTLQISDDAQGSPQSVSLTGTGVAQFSLSATSVTSTVLIGSTTATYTVSASVPTSSTFTGTIALGCTNLPTGVTCAANPTSISAGQTSMLTLSGLSASTTSPLNFRLNGIAGAQSATLPLTLLLEDYTLSGSPSLNTIAPGQSAKYTITLTPTNGFDKSVTMGCTRLPPSSSCSFDKSTVTPSGSPVTVEMTLVTTVQPAAAPPWPGFRGTPPRSMWWMAFLAGILGLILIELRRRSRQTLRAAAAYWKLVLVGATLAFLVFAGSCRNVIGTSGGTPCGTYPAISVTGTLTSNTAVVRTASLALAVTCPPAPH